MLGIALVVAVPTAADIPSGGTDTVLGGGQYVYVTSTGLANRPARCTVSGWTSLPTDLAGHDTQP